MHSLLGYTEKEVVGKTPYDLMPDDEKERVTKIFNDIIKLKKPIVEIENINIHKNGNLVVMESSGLPFFDATGKLLGYRGIDRDITFRKEVELALKENEAKLKESNNTKDMFFSILAHDLRSPFNTMFGFSDLLINQFDEYEVEEQKKYLNIINQGIHSTYKLLENLLLWSQSQRGTIDFNPQKENLYLLSVETLSLLNQLAKNKSIKLVNKIPKNMDVWVDKNMILTTLRNLISNGIKFTQNGGSVEIGCNTSNVKTSSGEFLPEIYVKDTGLGISKEKQSQLFKIAENISTKGTEGETGTGLGMILCKEFIEKHEGKIWVKSETGKGSEFIFTLWNN